MDKNIFKKAKKTQNQPQQKTSEKFSQDYVYISMIVYKTISGIWLVTIFRKIYIYMTVYI